MNDLDTLYRPEVFPNLRTDFEKDLNQGRIQGKGSLGTPKLHKEGKNVPSVRAKTPRFSSKILYPPLSTVKMVTKYYMDLFNQ